jgi:uncharacterized protein (TIGR03382 family)
MIPLLLSSALWWTVSPALANNIVNGEEESGFPSAVAIGSSEDTPLLGRMSMCTASLITPRILLTAGHCSEALGPQFGLSPEAFRPLFRDNGAALIGDNVASDETVEVRFAEILPHPDYTDQQGPTGTPGADMEVIVLVDDAPRRPTWFATDIDEEEIIGATVTSVGYGITDARSQQGSGIKRSAKLKISDVRGEFLLSASDDNVDEANICSGDSGGPQYRRAGNGRWLQVGIHSWGDQNCTQLSGSTRSDLDVEWLLSQVEAVHGTRDFCEASGLYGDGACDAECDEIDPDCLEEEEDARGGCACDARGGPLSGGWLVLLLAALLRRHRR